MLRRAGDLAPGKDLGTARFETFLRRLFSVKGVVAPAIEPKIQAGVELLTPPWVLGEAALLAGWRGYEAYASVIAAAGNFGCHELRPASGMVAVVEMVSCYQVATNQFTVGIRDSRPAGMSAVTEYGALDSRLGSVSSGLAAPACRPFAGSNNTAVGTVLNNYYLAAGQQNLVIQGPWVLLFNNPSATFQVLGLTANTAVACNIRWWERAIEPSELAAR